MCIRDRSDAHGLTRHALKVGDRVTVEINPLRDGQHGGSLKKIIVAETGQVLTSSLAPTPVPK